MSSASEIAQPSGVTNPSQPLISTSPQTETETKEATVEYLRGAAKEAELEQPRREEEQKLRKGKKRGEKEALGMEAPKQQMFILYCTTPTRI